MKLRIASMQIIELLRCKCAELYANDGQQIILIPEGNEKY